MPRKICIAMQLPETSRPGRYFTVRIAVDNQKQPSIYSMPTSLFVVSDVNKKIRSLYKLLIDHHIIDKHLQWTFGDGQLVILGNQFEGLELYTDCLWFIYSLEQKARSKGGCVHFILGSHEIAHMNGKWIHEHPSYTPETIPLQQPVTALYDANCELRRWLGNRKVVIKIGNLVFIHGSNLYTLCSSDYSIPEINEFIKSWYNSTTQQYIDNPSIVNPEKVNFKNSHINNIIIKDYHIASILKKFDAATLVIGYPIMDTAITFNGKLFNISAIQSEHDLKGVLIKKGEFIQAQSQGTG